MPRTVLDACIAALRAESRAIRELHNYVQFIPVLGGARCGPGLQPGSAVWSLYLDPGRRMPITGDDDPFGKLLRVGAQAVIRIGPSNITGELLAIEDALIRVHVSPRAGEALPPPGPGLIHVHAADLVEKLADVLSSAARTDNALPWVLDGAAFRERARRPPRADEDPVDAICAKPASLVWGPPGTGKTTLLARLVVRLVAAGERVLLVAPTNAAVDVAVRRVLSDPSLPGKRGAVVRFGYPAAAELEDVFKQCVAAPSEAAAARVAHARFVATTVAQTSLRPDVFKKFDTVILDEASMVSVPATAWAASFATARFVAAGDPHQLPPICAVTDEEHRRWLESTIFEQVTSSGADYEEDRFDFPRLCEQGVISPLRTQRRMLEAIGRVFELVYYSDLPGGIRHEPSGLAHAEVVREAPPWPGSPVVVSGPTARDGVATAEFENLDCPLWKAEMRDGSRRNLGSALAGLGLAVEAARSGVSVGIVTPYRMQCALYSALLLSLEEHIRGQISAGTVHRFQGNERDLIIFDVVDGPGVPDFGRLLRHDEPAARRLVNVAISRPRGKLIILAEPTWTMKSSRGVMRQLFEQGLGASRTDANRVDMSCLRELPGLRAAPLKNPEGFWLGLGRMDGLGLAQWETDVARAREEVVVSSPRWERARVEGALCDGDALSKLSAQVRLTLRVRGRASDRARRPSRRTGALAWDADGSTSAYTLIDRDGEAPRAWVGTFSPFAETPSNGWAIRLSDKALVEAVAMAVEGEPEERHLGKRG